MNTDRFETFFDAILAILITVVVLKLQQPSSPDWNALLQLNTGIITYLISFLVIFIIWYDNHNLFQVVDEIDNKILLIYGLQIFAISLLPYFASWVTISINSIAAETMFGLDFIVITILYFVSIYSVYKANPYNCSLSKANFKSVYKYVPLLINCIGFILTYTVYVPGIYVSVLISLIFWLLFSRLQEPDSGDTGRYEAFIDAIIAIIITIIVLEFPMVSNGSWESFLDLKLDFIVYAVSFLVCFNFWNYNNHISHLSNKINSRVIWLNGISLFVLSLIPYLTIFVAMNFNSFVPNFLYGLDFLIVAIMSLLAAKSLKDSDKANIALHIGLKNNNVFLSTILLVLCGMAIGYFAYPPAIIISCLISILLNWFIPYIGFKWDLGIF